MNPHPPKTNFSHHLLTSQYLNVPHNVMSLLTMRPNLQQVITRLIPHHDLLSLRLTCQYFNGFLPDVLLVKPLKWEDTEISLDFKSLLLLHGFSKTPRFRDAIINLAFFNPSGYRDEKAGKWHKSGVQREEAYAFAATDEAIYLFAECFRNLVSARKLEKIDIWTEVGAGSILGALHLAQFPRKIVEICFEVSELENHILGAFGSSSSRHAPSILSIELSGGDLQHGWYRGRSMKDVRKELEHNLDR
jgi:hypothetical protein